MTRLNIVLLLAVLASALYLVRTSYEARRLFDAAESERAREVQLQTEFERLEVTKRAQATPLRVEKIARERLRMFNTTAALTHYVGLNGAAVSDAAPAVASAAAGGAR
jgi:cell division protein FtsL